MAESTSESTPEVAINSSSPTDTVSNPVEPEDSFVKLAMRNMVRKGGQSLWHFFLTTVGLVTVLLVLAFLTKP